MSVEIWLIVAAAAAFGASLGWYGGLSKMKPQLAQLKHTMAEELAAQKTAIKAAKDAQATAEQQAAELGRQIANAERDLATLRVSEQTKQQELDRLSDELANTAAQLESEQNRAQELAEERKNEETATAPIEAGSVLELLKNDPALGPGQFNTLRMMYERFTTKSILVKKE